MRSEREAEKLLRENQGLLHRADAYLMSRYPTLTRMPKDQRLTVLSSALFKVCLAWNPSKAQLNTFFLSSLDKARMEMMESMGAVHLPHDRLARRGPFPTVSLERATSHAKGGEGDTVSLHDLLSKDPRSILAQLAEGERGKQLPALRAALATLTTRQFQVIEARYLAENPPSQEKLARALKLSRTRIQQLELQALKRMHLALTGRPRPKLPPRGPPKLRLPRRK